MNKYLKGFINLIIRGAIHIVGALFAINMMLVGFLFFPDVTARVAPLMDALPFWWANFFPGLLPFFVLLSILGLALFSIVLTGRLAGKCTIEKIINAMQKELKSSKKVVEK